MQFNQGDVISIGVKPIYWRINHIDKNKGPNSIGYMALKCDINGKTIKFQKRFSNKIFTEPTLKYIGNFPSNRKKTGKVKYTASQKVLRIAFLKQKIAEYTKELKMLEGE